MSDSIRELFLGGTFMPHGHCYFWSRGLILLHVASDALIFLSYLTIPVTLVYLVRKRRDIPFDWMFFCFGTFIVACGTTHLLEIWNVWHSAYWLSGTIKAVTAAASMATAGLLIRLVPTVLAIPNPDELRHVNERLQGEERFRLVVEAAPNAMVMVGKDGRIVLVNAQTEKLFGYSRKELLGQPIEIFVPERFRRAHPGHRDSFFGAPQTRSMGAGRDLYGVKKDGTEVPVEIGLNPIKTAEGSFVLASIIDITERKKSEEERRRTRELEAENKQIVAGSRLKSEFLANMSHELRTPLNGIIGFSEILHDGKAGTVNASQKEFLGDILNSSRHLLQLINDVLDLSKVEAGKMEFYNETLPLEKMIEEVRDVLRTLAAKKRIQVDFEVHAKVSKVTGDPSKLKQVLYNYLSNALKFTPEEGRVDIRALPEGPDFFRIEVEDTGVGIRPEDQNRLFVEFQQLDSTIAKKHPGTGLGLALTKRIVEAQGGRVGLRSSPGEGSTFFVILPRGDKSRARREHAPDQGGPGFGSDLSTVLVVEDNTADRTWLINKLTGSGYSVQLAATGQEALARCRDRRFGAVLLDLILPDMNGWEVLKAIRASGLNADVPVIIVTVVADKDAGTAYPIQDYLTKPVSAKALKQSLERAGIHPKTSPGPILVVDDDRKDLKIMSAHLDELGHEYIVARNGAEALKAAKAAAPAAIILDLVMPRMDGFEFLEKFRESKDGVRTPVIIWTGKNLTPEEAERLKRTTQALVRKGGPSRELIRQLKKVLPLPPARPKEAE